MCQSHQDARRVHIPESSDLPQRVVVGANGAYWRDYGDHYSMCPVSEDNEPIEVVAVYEQAAAPAAAEIEARIRAEGYKDGFGAAMDQEQPATEETVVGEGRERALSDIPGWALNDGITRWFDKEKREQPATEEATE